MINNNCVSIILVIDTQWELDIKDFVNISHKMFKENCSFKSGLRV